MRRQTIKLMADYDCYPLWHGGGDQIGNIDPRTLPISTALVEALRDWAAEYDSRLDRKDGSVSVTPEAEEAFDRTGIELARRLRQELGAGWDVVYFSDRLGRIL
jgi:hypothetical protein